MQQHLEKLGYPCWRLNSDEFGTRYQLQYTLNKGAAELYLQLEQKRIAAADITGVWYRKLWALQTPSALDTAYIPVFNKEYRTGLHIFFDALKTVPWINEMNADHAVCSNKLLQLQEAQQSGLQVPRTLLTNSPEQVHDLYTRCQGNLVMKLHGALSRSMEGTGAFFPTTRVTARHLSGLDTLAYCPMIFQELVPKVYELRVVYVCGAFFTGKINATQDAGGQTDWRAASAALPWDPYTLPDAVAAGIHALMQRLRLSFGAIDMIRRPGWCICVPGSEPSGRVGHAAKIPGLPHCRNHCRKTCKMIQHGLNQR